MKLLSSLLALCLCFAMVGCDEADYETENPDIPAAEPDGLDPTYDADESMDAIGETPGSSQSADDPEAIDTEPSTANDTQDDTPSSDPAAEQQTGETPNEPPSEKDNANPEAAEDQSSSDDSDSAQQSNKDQSASNENDDQ